MQSQLLDPISVISRLISLNFREYDTKMSIKNHTIHLQSPSSFQGFVRKYNGDGKENIAELYGSIVKIIKWYLIPHNSTLTIRSNRMGRSELVNRIVEQISKSKYFRKMVRYLCRALEKLQFTYKNGNVVLALQFYINLLRNSLNGKLKEEDLPKTLVEQEKKCENFIDYDKIKIIWDADKIKIICELYDNCYSIIKNKQYNESTKYNFINAYLGSIDSILQSTDREFKQLIKNSRKG
uniref:Uncharacterized protein n=1 Tax=Mimivirus LCMiAC02 TaxID=2506609 RepID=A0A481Z0X8_9VIRU|nr:MAG: uncharacterized protein LCMiAC02_02460 [Mimivirus LCMiAC02]